MKNLLNTLILVFITSLLFTSCGKEENKIEKQEMLLICKSFHLLVQNVFLEKFERKLTLWNLIYELL